MEALIIVHTERDALNPKLVGRERAERNNELFKNIAELVPRHLDVTGNRGYYLAEAAESPTSKWIYGPLLDYFRPVFQHPLQFIPHGNSFEEQCIQIKEKLREDDPNISYLVGITYKGNLLPLQRFLTGEVARLSRRDFEDAWEHLNRPAEQFERFYKQRMVAEIKEELTDK